MPKAKPGYSSGYPGFFISAALDEAIKLCYDVATRRCGGTGRHKGLKIPRSKIRTGSIPVSGTKIWDTPLGVSHIFMPHGIEPEVRSWGARGAPPVAGGATRASGSGRRRTTAFQSRGHPSGTATGQRHQITHNRHGFAPKKTPFWVSFFISLGYG